MKRYFQISILMIGMLSCIKQQLRIVSEHPEEEILIQSDWKEFVSAAEKKDRKILENMTLDSIRCYLCLENTEDEYAEIDRLRETSKDWFDIIYKDRIYIARNRFIKEDVPLLFNEKMIKRIKTGDTGFYERDIDGILYFEILVTTTEPNEVAIGHEGGQHAFLFKKTSDGYKLAEINTIP